MNSFDQWKQLLRVFCFCKDISSHEVFFTKERFEKLKIFLLRDFNLFFDEVLAENHFDFSQSKFLGNF